jgi:hypothetical protein
MMFERKHEDADEIRAQIRKSFSELRKMGYTARMNFMCCSSCARAEIENPKAVFYSHQSNDNLIKTGMIYLQWSGDHSEIIPVLEKNGLVVIHDGNDFTAILIKGLKKITRDYLYV